MRCPRAFIISPHPPDAKNIFFSVVMAQSHLFEYAGYLNGHEYAID
jgi:hypothetical protein